MFYNDRPRIKVPYSKKHKIIDVLSLLGIFLMAAATYISSLYMPERVPVHFDVMGNPDGFASSVNFFKQNMFFTCVNLIVWIVLSFLRKIPHYYNWPSKITAENAEKQYIIGVDFIYYLKACIILQYISIQLLSIISAFKGNLRYGHLFVLPPLLLICYFVGSFIYKSIKNK